MSNTIANLKSELEALRKASERIGARYDVLMRLPRGKRMLGFDGNSNALPRISEETYEFLNLEPEKEKRLREVNAAIIDDLMAWELANVSNIQSHDNSVSVEIAAMPQSEADKRLHYRESIRTLLDDADFEMIDATMQNALNGVYSHRKITVGISNEGISKSYSKSVEYFDSDGNPRGSSRSSGGRYPERYIHIFGKDL